MLFDRDRIRFHPTEFRNHPCVTLSDLSIGVDFGSSEMTTVYATVTTTDTDGHRVMTINPLPAPLSSCDSCPACNDSDATREREADVAEQASGPVDLDDVSDMLEANGYYERSRPVEMPGLHSVEFQSFVKPLGGGRGTYQVAVYAADDYTNVEVWHSVETFTAGEWHASNRAVGQTVLTAHKGNNHAAALVQWVYDTITND